MEPLTVLISFAMGGACGIGAGLVLQARNEILTPQKVMPDMKVLESVRWRREENGIDLQIIKNEAAGQSALQKLYQVRLSNIARPLGEASKEAQKNIEYIYVDALLMNVGSGNIQEAVLRADNPNFREITYLMNKLGIPVRSPA